MELSECTARLKPLSTVDLMCCGKGPESKEVIATLRTIGSGSRSIADIA